MSRMEPPSERYTIRWNSYNTVLQTVLRDLLRSEKYVDVTLASEGKSIKCHRVVLSACSPYFEKILEDNTDSTLVVYLTHVQFWELKALMDFMYSGEVTVSKMNINRFFEVAQMLKIKGLAEDDTTTPMNEQRPEDKMTTVFPKQGMRLCDTGFGGATKPQSQNCYEMNGVSATIPKQSTQPAKRKTLASPHNPSMRPAAKTPRMALRFLRPGSQGHSSNETNYVKSHQREVTQKAQPSSSHSLSTAVAGSSKGGGRKDKKNMLLQTVPPDCTAILRALLQNSSTAADTKHTLQSAKKMNPTVNAPAINTIDFNKDHDLNSITTTTTEDCTPLSSSQDKVGKKFGKDTRESMVAALRSGMSISECSESFGVSRKTVYRWQKQLTSDEQAEAQLPNAAISSTSVSNDVSLSLLPGTPPPPPSPVEFSSGNLPSPTKEVFTTPTMTKTERKERIKNAAEMAMTGGTVRGAALAYGIPRTTLVFYMKRHGMVVPKSTHTSQTSGAEDSSPEDETVGGGFLPGANFPSFKTEPNNGSGSGELVTESEIGQYEGSSEDVKIEGFVEACEDVIDPSEFLGLLPDDSD